MYVHPSVFIHTHIVSIHLHSPLHPTLSISAPQKPYQLSPSIHTRQITTPTLVPSFLGVIVGFQLIGGKQNTIALLSKKGLGFDCSSIS
ncbi:hypothetical protein L1987_81801 [Smallanthus sonchifolius]|uniref:Uncharacterized protein n=1 Tax=Smallanthus sonchifolius TaxID=185202 RepID=A0ACB8YRQ5_9ASTR|nr:hypothetical protein L1987_81801 [Smallanthus sonchifolius]